MISSRSSGSFHNLERYLNNALAFDPKVSFDAYAREGVRALAAATPKDSSRAAESWTYEITGTAQSGSIVWKNTDIEEGFPVAIRLQFGYATGTGGYVAGRDYINPAIQPIFDRLSREIERQVKAL